MHADRQRQAGRREAAEDDHQQHEQDRQRDRLGPRDVGADLLVDVPVDDVVPPIRDLRARARAQLALDRREASAVAARRRRRQLEDRVGRRAGPCSPAAGSRWTSRSPCSTTAVRRAARRGTRSPRPEGRVVDGQVGAASTGRRRRVGAAEAVLGRRPRRPCELSLPGVVEAAAGHGAEDAGAPDAGEHHERRASQRPRPSAAGGTITRPRVSNMVVSSANVGSAGEQCLLNDGVHCAYTVHGCHGQCEEVTTRRRPWAR